MPNATCYLAVGMCLLICPAEVLFKAIAIYLERELKRELRTVCPFSFYRVLITSSTTIFPLVPIQMICSSECGTRSLCTHQLCWAPGFGGVMFNSNGSSI